MCAGFTVRCIDAYVVVFVASLSVSRAEVTHPESEALSVAQAVHSVAESLHTRGECSVASVPRCIVSNGRMINEP
jgi:hypothetical protein